MCDLTSVECDLWDETKIHGHMFRETEIYTHTICIYTLEYTVG